MITTYMGYVGIAPFDGNNAARVSVGTPSTSATLAVAGSISTKVRTVTAATTLGQGADISDSVILSSLASAGTITLPTASAAAGRQLTIKSIGVGATSIVAAGGGNVIDGTAEPVTITGAPYPYVTVTSDGSASWWVTATSGLCMPSGVRCYNFPCCSGSERIMGNTCYCN
jgi:hypothetical protein